jgi:hypothetical protein
VDVIGHYAPREKAIALSIEVPDGFGDNSCDSRIKHETVTVTGIEKSLGLLDGYAQFLGTNSISGYRDIREGGSFNRVALRAELVEDFDGE